jgi:L-iditol 2-dehydrogenase
MRAAFMTGVGAIEVRDVEEPAIEPGGVLLRTQACGICGTDARTFFNGDPRAPAPWLLGHEPVGLIEEVGPDADLPDGLKPGDRAFLGSILTCGQCRMCQEGHQNLCLHEKLYGFDPHPGAYAEWAVVPPIGVKNLMALDPDLPSELATVADPLACALNGIEMLDIRMGDAVVVLGSGPIGAMQCVMARDRGASRVYLMDVSAERLKLALDVVGGFVDDGWVAGEDNGVSDVKDRTDGFGAERVIVAAPSKQAQQAALVMAAPRATVVYFAGLPKADPVVPFDANQLHYKELSVLGAYGCTPHQYRVTLDLLARRRDVFERVVTHRFGLEDIANGFETIRSGTGLKVVIEP